MKFIIIFEKCVAFLLVFIILIAHYPVVTADSSDELVELVVSYFDYLNSKDYYAIQSILYESERTEFLNFINDDANRINHIGIFNFKTSNIVSITQVLDYIDVYNLSQYNDIVNVFSMNCYVSVETYNDSDYLDNGVNSFHLIIVENLIGEFFIFGIARERHPIIFNTQNENGVRSYDAPVFDNSLGIWQTPSTINVRNYGTVDFRNYCNVVTMNEFGNSSYNQDARRAVAMAIKNYGWNRTLVQKYPNYEYDVRETTEDQVYNPTNIPTSSVISAVTDIYGYVMLSCDYGLFPGFHCSSSSTNSHATYHGGILSQLEANSLGNSGMSWKDILHYYYDYGSYNMEMTQGVIRIVDLSHAADGTSYYSNSFYHWKECSICGRKHHNNHDWILNPIMTNYRCTVCGRVSTYIPIPRFIS